MAIDRNKMIMFMGMTMSRHDNEALTALRKANAMLLAENLTWQEFLTGPDTPHRSPPSQRRYDDIETMFEEAFRNASTSPSFREFLNGIYGWWTVHESLTPKQYDALKKAAGR